MAVVEAPRNSHLRHTLITGPSGSGKSRWAEHLAANSGLAVVYLATGPCLPDDAAWQERLERHRRRRPTSWICRDVGGDLTEALQQLQPQQLGLVDALGTWVAAHLADNSDDWQQRVSALLLAIDHCPARLLLVGDEVSWGVVPSTAAGGLFRERLATLQRSLALAVDEAWLVVQGRALNLTQLGVAVPS